MPLIHKDDAVGHFAGKTHFVGDTYHRHAFLRELDHNVEHFADHFRIERGRRFVEQHDVGLHGEGAGNGDALLLAAGKHTRVDVDLFGQPHFLEQLERALLGFVFGNMAELHGRHRQVLEHGLVREQVEALEHHAQILPDLVDVVLGGVDVAPLDKDGALVDDFQAVDGAQQR